MSEQLCCVRSTNKVFVIIAVRLIQQTVRCVFSLQRAEKQRAAIQLPTTAVWKSGAKLQIY